MVKKMTITNADNIIERVNNYATEKGITQQDAARRLLLIGLMAENDGIYTSELSRVLSNSVNEEMMAMKQIIHTELQGIADCIDERLCSAEAAAYATLFATLKGDIGESASVAADIFTCAGNRYAAGEPMHLALQRAREIYKKAGE